MPAHPQAPVALITGAAKRIGAAIAELFHHQGYRVIIHYRHSAEQATQLCKRLNALRADSARILHADLNDSTAVQQLATDALACYGGIDVLINNASSFYATPLPAVSVQDWDDLINSNVKAAFFLSQALADSLQQRGGSIINIIDIHADGGLTGFPVYCIAKAGLKMLTRSLARELAPAVRVNGVSPGAILWPEQAAESTEPSVEPPPEPSQEQRRIVDSIPLGHLGAAVDIAQTVWFLAHAGYITGQIIRVDGGRSLR
jgi:pteridine reductase